MEFSGAKLLLLIGRDMVTIQRDARDDIAWPGMWDLPGGGREGDETPETCVLREVREEVGLVMEDADLIYRRFYRAPTPAWFFAARLPEARAADLTLGDEGQQLALVNPADWVLRGDIIPHFRLRVAEAMEALLGA